MTVRIADVMPELRCSPTHVSTDWSTDRVSLVETTIASATKTIQHAAEIATATMAAAPPSEPSCEGVRTLPIV